MEYKFTIKGRLDGLNTVINVNRGNKYGGANLKAANDQICRYYILNQLKGVHINNPVMVEIDWYEQDRRRDLDNIYSAKKFILDALKECRVIHDDSQKWVTGLVDRIHMDKKRPRIEVTIIEVGEEHGRLDKVTQKNPG